MPKPCHDRHPDPDPDCRLCWLARHDARYRRLWGIPGPPEPVPPGSGFRPAARSASAPCVHLGEPLLAGESAALGLNPARDWRRCGLGLSVGGSPPGVVCACRGCGPTCPSYSPAPPA